MNNVEKIPGTKVVGQRLANAELHFQSIVQELTGCTKAEATKAFKVMRKFKVIKLDSSGDHYNAIHGAYMEPFALRNAINFPD